MLCPSASVIGYSFAYAVHSAWFTALSAPHALEPALNADLISARLPVPIGCTGALRLRVYCPARLWEYTVPAKLPDCGIPRYFICQSYRCITTQELRAFHECGTPVIVS